MTNRISDKVWISSGPQFCGVSSRHCSDKCDTYFLSTWCCIEITRWHFLWWWWWWGCMALGFRIVVCCISVANRAQLKQIHKFWNRDQEIPPPVELCIARALCCGASGILSGNCCSCCLMALLSGAYLCSALLGEFRFVMVHTWWLLWHLCWVCCFKDVSLSTRFLRRCWRTSAFNRNQRQHNWRF